MAGVAHTAALAYAARGCSDGSSPGNSRRTTSSSTSTVILNQGQRCTASKGSLLPKGLELSAPPAQPPTTFTCSPGPYITLTGRSIIDAIANDARGSTAKVRRSAAVVAAAATNLSAAVRTAISLLPTDTANRILLVSDGNETEASVLEAIELATANDIPVLLYVELGAAGLLALAAVLHFPDRPGSPPSEAAEISFKVIDAQAGNGAPADAEKGEGQEEESRGWRCDGSARARHRWLGGACSGLRLRGGEASRGCFCSENGPAQRIAGEGDRPGVGPVSVDLG